MNHNNSTCNIDAFTTIAKAVSDPNRIRALMALRKGELCVCQIIELLRLAPSTVSKHMTILKHSRLVKSRKDERWMFYRLPDLLKDDFISNSLSWIFASLEKNSDICKDAKSIVAITKQNPSLLCKTNGKK